MVGGQLARKGSTGRASAGQLVDELRHQILTKSRGGQLVERVRANWLTSSSAPGSTGRHTRANWSRSCGVNWLTTCGPTGRGEANWLTCRRGQLADELEARISTKSLRGQLVDKL
nr:hypothetical protein CFP56_79504 [Quercus suber]